MVVNLKLKGVLILFSILFIMNTCFAINNDSKTTDELYEEGKEYYNNGSYLKAVECYDKVLEMDPKYPRIMLTKNLALSKINRSERAIEYYDNGTYFYNRGQYENAIACYEEALKADPNYTYAVVFKGVVFISLKQYEDAVECSDKALELDPNHVSLWLCKAGALANSNPNECIEYCSEALKLYPNDSLFWFFKGSSLSKIDKCEEADECFDRAVELNPTILYLGYVKDLT